MNNKKTLLINLRNSKNLNQEQMATILGMSRPHYVMIENGDRKGHIIYWLRLQHIFKLSAEELLDLMKEGTENELFSKGIVKKNRKNKKNDK